MRIRTKFLFGYLLVASLVMAVLYVGFRVSLVADNAFRQTTQQSFPIDKVLDDMRGSVLRIVSSTNEHLFLSAMIRLSHTPERVADEAREAMEHEVNLIANADNEFKKALSQFGVLSQRDRPQDQTFLSEVSRAGETFLHDSRALISLSKGGHFAAELLERKEVFEASEMRLLKLINDGLETEDRSISQLVASSTDQLHRVRHHFAALAIFLVLGLLAVVFAVTTYISRPMQQLVRRAAEIEKPSPQANNDSPLPEAPLRHRRDEIGELDAALDAMQARLDDSRARLEQHQDTLEQNIAERTVALEVALDRANTLAREAHSANAAKAAFLANMSHEIRTPLNGVMGTAELLWHSELTTHQRNLVDTINRSGDNLMRIINDILDFSKIDAGRLDLEHASFSLGDTLEEVVTLLGPGAHAKHIELVADFELDVYAPVLGEAGRLRQILLNLLSNAIKFTQSGEVRLMARATPRSPTTVALHIQVADTGIGMPEEVQKRLFQPFSQADASTTRRFGGTGLGLAISHQLVELMHGTLEVNSAVGEGTTFTLQLELPSDPNASPVVQDNAKLRVILVQPNTRAREATAALLTAAGIQTQSMANAQAAIEWAQRNQTDCVIAENLESEDGRRLVEAATRAGADIALVEPYAQCADEFANQHIQYRFSKPITRGQLSAYLRHRAERKRAAKGNDGGTMQAERPLLSFNSAYRVLIAEDNAVNRMVAMQMLKRLGLVATAVENGRLALEAVQQSNYDLVFMDCHMPEMDGYEATKRIRQFELDQGRSRTPIVALTADALSGARELTLKAGMDDYVSKPVSIKALADVLQNWLVAETA